MASVTAASVAPPGTAGFLAAAASARDPVAWMANYASNTVSPVNVATRTAGPQIPAGAGPWALAMTPDGRTLYVAAPLNVGASTYPTAITLAGPTGVVVEPYGYSVTLIDTKTGRVHPPVTVGSYPVAAAITG